MEKSPNQNNDVTENSSETKKSIFIPKETMKRLLLDIKDIIKEPLHDQFIYYKHSDEDMLVGYAMIIGPEDSLYFGGYYFFKFDFPINYPHSPPSVTYLTNDGETRFHPNLYKTGKVCLSILNTWRGEQWTGCQTIKSVLLTIMSVMDKKPLLHEPGITESHFDFNKYKNIIEYKNIDFSIIRILNNYKINTIVMEYKDYFYPFMVLAFEKNAKKINEFLLLPNKPNGIHTTSIYTMHININYENTLRNFKSLMEKMKIEN